MLSNWALLAFLALGLLSQAAPQDLDPHPSRTPVGRAQVAASTSTSPSSRAQRRPRPTRTRSAFSRPPRSRFTWNPTLLARTSTHSSPPIQSSLPGTCYLLSSLRVSESALTRDAAACDALCGGRVFGLYQPLERDKTRCYCLAYANMKSVLEGEKVPTDECELFWGGGDEEEWEEWDESNPGREPGEWAEMKVTLMDGGEFGTVRFINVWGT